MECHKNYFFNRELAHPGAVRHLISRLCDLLIRPLVDKLFSAKISKLLH